MGTTDRPAPVAQAARSDDLGVAQRRIMRTCGLAAAVGLLIVAGIAASGLLPIEATPFLWLGAGVACLTGLIGIYLLARCTTIVDADPGRTARLYFSGLAGNLGLQVLTACGLIIGFSLAGQKFAAVAALGLTFAAMVAVIHITGSIAISRFLRARARATLASSGPASVLPDSSLRSGAGDSRARGLR